MRTYGVRIAGSPVARLPEPAPLGEEPETVAATVAAEALVAAGNEVLQRADGGTEGIDAIATGFVPANRGARHRA